MTTNCKILITMLAASLTAAPALAITGARPVAQLCEDNYANELPSGTVFTLKREVNIPDGAQSVNLSELCTLSLREISIGQSTQVLPHSTPATVREAGGLLTISFSSDSQLAEVYCFAFAGVSIRCLRADLGAYFDIQYRTRSETACANPTDEQVLLSTLK